MAPGWAPSGEGRRRHCRAGRTRPPGDGRAKGGRLSVSRSRRTPPRPPGRNPPLRLGRATTPTGGQQGSAGQPAALGSESRERFTDVLQGLGAPRPPNAGLVREPTTRGHREASYQSARRCQDPQLGRGGGAAGQTPDTRSAANPTGSTTPRNRRAPSAASLASAPPAGR